MIPVCVDSRHLALCLGRIRPVDLIHRKALEDEGGWGWDEGGGAGCSLQHFGSGTVPGLYRFFVAISGGGEEERELDITQMAIICQAFY